jgi:hypothetical protein
MGASINQITAAIAGAEKAYERLDSEITLVRAEENDSAAALFARCYAPRGASKRRSQLGRSAG